MTTNIYNNSSEDCNIRFSYIHNSRDTKPKLLAKKWGDFIEWLESISYLPKEATKEFKLTKTPAIMPAIFDGYRKDDNVIGFGSWVMIDADKHKIPLNDMIDYFKRYNLNGCIYSTTSHSSVNHCLRGIIQIDREYDAGSHDLVWDTIYQMFDCKLDDSCNTLGRIYYIPAKWSTDSVFIKMVGEPLNIDEAQKKYYKKFSRPTKVTNIIDDNDYVILSKPSESDKENDFTDDDLIFMLKTISFRPKRNDWIRLSWAVRSYSTNAEYVLNSSWPEETKGEYNDLLQNQYKEIMAPTIGSIIHEAMRCDPDVMRKLPSNIDSSCCRNLVDPPTAVVSGSAGSNNRPEAATPKDQHWVERFNDCVVNIIDAPCGAGKTYEMLNNIVIQGGRWLYVCDTIRNIKEREVEFREFCAKQNVRNFQISKAYYQDSVPVSKQIDEILNAVYCKNVVIFISNAALQIIDASKFQGFSLVIDEAYEVLGMHERKWDYNIKLADMYFQVNDTNSDYYQIVSTEAGDRLVQDRAFDDINATFRDLLETLSKQYATLWCHKSSWEKRAATRLTFWAISSPEYIKHFNSVWLMGDEIKQSPIYNVWNKQHKVSFKFVNLKRARERKVPLKDRGMICYFAEHRQASISQFKKGDSPLMEIIKWLGETHGDNPFIIAQHSEEKNYGVMNISDVCKNAEVLTLKTTGLNQYQHHTMCVWLGALKLSGQDQEVMKTVFEIDISTQIRWREFNPLYQFVMRTSLRNYDSTTFNKVYVFDRKQAEYLHERTGMPIQHISGVIKVDGVGKGGRPKANHAQTSAERQRAFRERKKAAIGNPLILQQVINEDVTKTPNISMSEVVSVIQVECPITITPKSFGGSLTDKSEVDNRLAFLGKLNINHKSISHTSLM